MNTTIVEKYKYLLKNIGILAVSNFSSKILSFFLIPLYTSVLTTGEYGTYDLFNTTINLLVPLLTLNIFDGILRFSMDSYSHWEKKSIFNYGCKLTIGGSALVAAFVFLNSFIVIIPTLNKYGIFFIGMFVTNAFSQLFSNFVRGLGKVSDVAIAGIIGSITGLLFNLYFLLLLQIGIIGFFGAGILSELAMCVYYYIKIPLYKYKSNQRISKTLKKGLLLYSFPMLLNTIGWWVNNLSDRYIVTGICGIESNGIYSMGYRIPSLLNVFVSIFGQAWTLSAVKEFDSIDKEGFFSDLYNSYNGALIIITSAIICFDKPLAKLLYAKNFYNAWKFVPFLTIASMFGALSGFFGGIFAAKKDSRSFGYSTIIGAMLNIVLNFVLVEFYGPIGAAFSTMISYFFIYTIRFHFIKKHIMFRMNFFKDTFCYFLLLIQASILFLQFSSITLVIQLLLLCVTVVVYKDSISKIVLKVLKKR